MGNEGGANGRRGGRRRWARTGVAVATVALLLAAVACGGDDASDTATSGSSGSSGAAGDGEATALTGFPVEDGAFPVTIEHKYGSTTIDEEPERIVTVGLIEQDALLALGIVPVATTEWFGEKPGAVFPWAEDELEALGAEPPELVGDATAPNVEAVAAQRPDLILAIYSDISEQAYEQLSAVAPTVAQPGDHIDLGVPWEELTRTVGEAVGRPAAADQLVAEVEDQFATVREDDPEFAGASALMATPYEGIYVYGPEDPRGQFLTTLGFELPPDLVTVTGEEFGGDLSEERADMLDVDVIVWLDPDDAEGPLGGPLYDAMDVHTEAREVPVDSFDDPLGAATSFVTVLSLPYLLDGIVPQLAAAVDGDPATAVADARPDGT